MKQKKNNYLKTWVLITIFIILSILLMLSSVLAYNINVTENITLIIVPNQFAIGIENVYTWYNTSNYSTSIVPLNISVWADDLNTTYLQPYFHTLYNDLIDDISLKLNNVSTNVPQSLQDNISNSINIYMNQSLINSNKVMGDDIVYRIDTHIADNCNKQEYKDYVYKTLTSSILPNITEYNNLKTQVTSLTTDLATTYNKLSDSDKSLKDKSDEYSQMTWIAIVLLLILLTVLYLDFGEQAFSALRRAKWRKPKDIPIIGTSYVPPVVPPPATMETTEKVE